MIMKTQIISTKYYIILKKIFAKIEKKKSFCKILLKVKKLVLILTIFIKIAKTNKKNLKK